MENIQRLYLFLSFKQFLFLSRNDTLYTTDVVRLDLLQMQKDINDSFV